MNQPLSDDLAQVARGLAEVFPSLEDITPLSRLGSDHISEVFETADGNVFCVGKNAAAVASYEHATRLLPLLRPCLDLPVPEPKWYAGSSPQMPFGVLGYRKIPGMPLSKRHLRILDWRRLAADIAGFLYQLHGIPAARFSGLDLPVFHARPEALEVIKSKVLPYLQMVLSAGEYDVAHRWFEGFLHDKRMQEYQPVLIHDEIYYANVLLDEGTSRVTGVVGFGDATLGDPAQDIAVQYHLGRDFAEAVIAAYRQLMGTLGTAFEYRVHQLWILREFDGLRFYVETSDVEGFAYSVSKMRNSPLFLADI